MSIRIEHFLFRVSVHLRLWRRCRRYGNGVWRSLRMACGYATVVVACCPEPPQYPPWHRLATIWDERGEQRTLGESRG